MGEADLARPRRILLAGMAVGVPDLGPLQARDLLGHPRGAISCRTAPSGTNTQGHCVTPSGGLAPAHLPDLPPRRPLGIARRPRPGVAQSGPGPALSAAA